MFITSRNNHSRTSNKDWKWSDTGLKSFIIPNNVIEVGENIIGASINLTTISFGDGIKSFKDVRIQEKDIIENVSIGKSVKSFAQDILDGIIY